MVIAVLGASGFIGLKLVSELIEQKNHVRVLSRKKEYPIPGVEVFVGDLTDPDINLEDFMHHIDVLYNCSGEIKNISLMRELHVFGTERVISFAIKEATLWIQLSSVGAYGTCRNKVVTEKCVESPVGVYETTKTESDDLVRRSGMDYVILRPSNVFDLSMSNQSLFQLIRLIRKKYFFYIGKGGYQANYVHVDDVVSSLILCSKNRNALYNTFILSQTLTVEKMIESFQLGLRIQYKPFRVPESLIRVFVKTLTLLYRALPLTESRIDALTCNCRYDSTKINEKLGFEFDSSLEDRFSELSSHFQYENQRKG